MSTQAPPLSKKDKKFLTAYWGIELDNTAFEYSSIKEYLESNPHLVKLQKIHLTLLYVGKVNTMKDKEDTIAPYVGKNCKLTIDAFGCSDIACALRVKNITLCDDAYIVVPSYTIQQHITMALKVGTPAKDSVLTLTTPDTNNGKVVMLPEELVLMGTIKRYMF